MNIIDQISRKIFGSSGEEDENDIEKGEAETSDAAAKPETKEPPQQNSGYTGNNVVDFNSAVSNREDLNGNLGKFSKTEIRKVEPKSFNEAPTLANYLRDNITVILNLEGTEVNEARRIVDFLSGTIYAIDGKIRPVGEKVFICATNNVTLTTSEDVRKPIGKF